MIKKKVLVKIVFLSTVWLGETDEGLQEFTTKIVNSCKHRILRYFLNNNGNNIDEEGNRREDTESLYKKS